MFASERECREWLEQSPNTSSDAEKTDDAHLHTLAVVCTSLPLQRQKQLREIAAAFPKLFSYSPGKIKGMEVDMELIPNAKPVRHPIQQFGRAQAEIVRLWITSALADGSYERARPDNDWASRVHIAPSRNASGMLSKMRICGDYRDVNKLFSSVAQRTPNPDAIKEALAGFTYYGKCDLAVGYGNLALSPRTRQILAVWTPIGLMQPTGAPFGPKNCSVYMQVAMERALATALPQWYGRSLFVYQDDIYWVANDWETYLKPPKIHCLHSSRLVHTSRRANCSLASMSSPF